jgi:hypothetical protein
MKKTKRVITILLLLSFLPAIAFSQKKDVVIRIVQDESFLLGDFQTNITLKKKGFKFQILLENTEGVYVFASIEDSVYRFTENSPIQDFSYLKLLELRDDDQFNTNKELNMSKTGWSYWFYRDSAQWHPFNRKIVGMGPGRNVCTKVIKQLYDVTEGNIVKFKNMRGPLYLLFVAVKDYDENGQPKTELMRRKLKIEWSDED